MPKYIYLQLFLTGKQVQFEFHVNILFHFFEKISFATLEKNWIIFMEIAFPFCM